MDLDFSESIWQCRRLRIPDTSALTGISRKPQSAETVTAICVHFPLLEHDYALHSDNLEVALRDWACMIRETANDDSGRALFKQSNHG